MVLYSPYVLEGPFSELRPEGVLRSTLRIEDRGGADHIDLLFVRWWDGFEEIYDYQGDPHLYEGRVGTPREQRYAGMLRERLLAMRTAAGDRYRALETA